MRVLEIVIGVLHRRESFVEDFLDVFSKCLLTCISIIVYSVKSSVFGATKHYIFGLLRNIQSVTAKEDLVL